MPCTMQHAGRGCAVLCPLNPKPQPRFMLVQPAAPCSWVTLAPAPSVCSLPQAALFMPPALPFQPRALYPPY